MSHGIFNYDRLQIQSEPTKNVIDINEWNAYQTVWPPQLNPQSNQHGQTHDHIRPLPTQEQPIKQDTIGILRNIT